MGGVFRGDDFDFVEATLLPFRRVAEITEDPSCINAGIELGGEEGAHRELGRS